MATKDYEDLMLKPENVTAFAESLYHALENGTTPWQKEWISGKPYNPTRVCFKGSTGYEYILGNQRKLQLATALLGFKDPRWLTERELKDGTRWNGQNIKVNADGKEITVKPGQAYTVLRKPPKTYLVVTDADGKRVPKKEYKGKTIEEIEAKFPGAEIEVRHTPGPGFAIYNVEQLENVDLEKLKPIPPTPPHPEQAWENYENAELIIRALEAKGLTITHDQTDRNFYSPTEDTIHACHKWQFKNAETYYSTLLHEVCHATAHKSRLNCDLGGRFGTPSYAREELRAEIASFLLCQAAGVPGTGGDKNHEAYVVGWMKLLKDDPAELGKALVDATERCDWVLRAKEEYEKEHHAELSAMSNRFTISVNAQFEQERQRRLEEIHMLAKIDVTDPSLNLSRLDKAKIAYAKAYVDAERSTGGERNPSTIDVFLANPDFGKVFGTKEALECVRLLSPDIQNTAQMERDLNDIHKYGTGKEIGLFVESQPPSERCHLVAPCNLVARPELDLTLDNPESAGEIMKAQARMMALVKKSKEITPAPVDGYSMLTLERRNGERVHYMVKTTWVETAKKRLDMPDKDVANQMCCCHDERVALILNTELGTQRSASTHQRFRELCKDNYTYGNAAVQLLLEGHSPKKVRYTLMDASPTVRPSYKFALERTERNVDESVRNLVEGAKGVVRRMIEAAPASPTMLDKVAKEAAARGVPVPEGEMTTKEARAFLGDSEKSSTRQKELIAALDLPEFREHPEDIEKLSRKDAKTLLDLHAVDTAIGNLDRPSARLLEAAEKQKISLTADMTTSQVVAAFQETIEYRDRPKPDDLIYLNYEADIVPEISATRAEVAKMRYDDQIAKRVNYITKDDAELPLRAMTKADGKISGVGIVYENDMPVEKTLVVPVGAVTQYAKAMRAQATAYNKPLDKYQTSVAAVKMMLDNSKYKYSENTIRDVQVLFSPSTVRSPKTANTIMKTATRSRSDRER